MLLRGVVTVPLNAFSKCFIIAVIFWESYLQLLLMEAGCWWQKEGGCLSGCYQAGKKYKKRFFSHCCHRVMSWQGRESSAFLTPLFVPATVAARCHCPAIISVFHYLMSLHCVPVTKPERSRVCRSRSLGPETPLARLTAPSLFTKYGRGVQTHPSSPGPFPTPFPPLGPKGPLGLEGPLTLYSSKPLKSGQRGDWISVVRVLEGL